MVMMWLLLQLDEAVGTEMGHRRCMRQVLMVLWMDRMNVERLVRVLVG